MPTQKVEGYYRKDGTYIKPFLRVFSLVCNKRRNRKFDQAYGRHLSGESMASIGRTMQISGVSVGHAFHRRGFAKPENWLSVKDQRDLMCAKLQSDLIKNLICNYYKFPIQEFDKSISKGRQEHQFIKIRHIIAYMMDRHINVKRPDIAKELGYSKNKKGFYSSSIIGYIVKKIKGYLCWDKRLTKEIAEIDYIVNCELTMETDRLVLNAISMWTSVLKGGKESFLEAWKKTDTYNKDYNENNN